MYFLALIMSHLLTCAEQNTNVMAVHDDRTMHFAFEYCATNLFSSTRCVQRVSFMQLQEFQERQKKIADMEARLQSQDEELGKQQNRIKTLHVRTATLTIFLASFPLP